MNVVITGATKGIGRAIAEKFAAAGYCIIACSRNEADLIKMKEEFAALFPSIQFLYKQVDVGDKRAVIEFGEWILAQGLFPDILINNAGYFTPGSCYNEDEGMLEKTMAVNLYGPYHLSRSLIPTMIKNRQGHIFNICSVASFKAFDNVGAYGISKFALLGFTKNLREEMKPYGIKVTAVCPGATFTASWDGADIDPARIMEEADIATMVFAASQLSSKAVVEDIILRPQLGDL